MLSCVIGNGSFYSVTLVSSSHPHVWAAYRTLYHGAVQHIISSSENLVIPHQPYICPQNVVWRGLLSAIYEIMYSLFILMIYEGVNPIQYLTLSSCAVLTSLTKTYLNGIYYNLEDILHNYIIYINMISKCITHNNKSRIRDYEIQCFLGVIAWYTLWNWQWLGNRWFISYGKEKTKLNPWKVTSLLLTNYNSTCVVAVLLSRKTLSLCVHC